MTGTTRIPAAEITGLKGAVISFVVEGGRISRIYAVRNPAKLGRIDVEATIRH